MDLMELSHERKIVITFVPTYMKLITCYTMCSDSIDSNTHICFSPWYTASIQLAARRSYAY